jgi:hypothetical protein
MSAKREARRQRSALERENKERQRRQKMIKTRVLMVLGTAAVLAFGFYLTQREPPGGGQGKVWSAAHGHWHDR